MIIIGCDHGGYALKADMLTRLMAKGYTLEDRGCTSNETVDYPLIAADVCRQVLAHPDSWGILFCGTGIGMSIAANKYPGIRAAHVSDVYSARMSKEHNNANIITLGGRTLGNELAWEIICAYLNASFSGGIHAARLQQISSIEAEAGRRMP